MQIKKQNKINTNKNYSVGENRTGQLDLTGQGLGAGHDMASGSKTQEVYDKKNWSRREKKRTINWRANKSDEEEEQVGQINQ